MNRDGIHLRVAAKWARTRTYVGTASAIAGIGLWLTTWLFPLPPVPPNPDGEVEIARACATATVPDLLRHCLPTRGEVSDPARYAELLEANEDALPPQSGEDPVSSTARELAVLARDAAKARLPHLEAARQARNGVLGRAWSALYWTGFGAWSILNSTVGTLFGLILVAYGLASVFWARRRFHLRLDRTTFAIGPPTGVIGRALGSLTSVSLRDQRIVIEERSGREVVSPQLQISDAVVNLVEATNAAIPAAAEHAASQMVLQQTPDAIRIDQRWAPGWAQLGRWSTVIGVVGLFFTAIATGSIVRFQYQLPEGADEFADLNPAVACAKSMWNGYCQRVRPDALLGLPDLQDVRRWREQDLTFAHLNGSEPPTGDSSLHADPRLGLTLADPRAQDWIARLVADRRNEPAYIRADLVDVSEPARSEIAQAADRDVEVLRGLIGEAYGQPEVQAAWDRTVLRDQQIRDGVPWVLIQDLGLPVLALFLIFLAMIAVPIWLRRRSIVSATVGVTGVRIGKRRLSFADIAEIGVENKRIVVTTRRGERFRTGRLTSERTADPLVLAVSERVLDQGALDEEAAQQQAAEAELGPALSRGRQEA